MKTASHLFSRITSRRRGLLSSYLDTGDARSERSHGHGISPFDDGRHHDAQPLRTAELRSRITDPDWVLG